MADKGPEVKSRKVGATRKASNCSCELNFCFLQANLIQSNFSVFICQERKETVTTEPPAAGHRSG